MNYYIIYYSASCNGESFEGTVGVVSRTTDYLPNLVRRQIIDLYKREHHCKNVLVGMYTKKVTQDIFNNSQFTFMRVSAALT